MRSPAVSSLTRARRRVGAAPLRRLFETLAGPADTDLTDAVVTVDALHAQTAHARYLVEQRKAHYLLSVKHNQPTLARQLAKLPWREIPVQDRSRDRGHGREEVREVKVASVDNLLFPHANQVVRIHRKRRRLGTKAIHRHQAGGSGLSQVGQAELGGGGADPGGDQLAQRMSLGSMGAGVKGRVPVIRS